MTDDDHFVCCTGLATSMLACNVQGQVLGNADVRRALSLAIDREYLADTLYRETRSAADGMVSPAITGYQEAAWPYATYDNRPCGGAARRALPPCSRTMRAASRCACCTTRTAGTARSSRRSSRTSRRWA